MTEILWLVITIYWKAKTVHVNQQFPVFYQFRSAYAREEISSSSDILAVILFDQFSKTSTIKIVCMVCVCVCVCVPVYLTSYSDCLTGFFEPHLPLYRCHTGLKDV